MFALGEALAGTLGRGGVPASGDVARSLGDVCRRTHVGFRRDLLHHLAAALQGTADVPRLDARATRWSPSEMKALSSSRRQS